MEVSMAEQNVGKSTIKSELSDRCISCLIENVIFRTDTVLKAVYKEVVDRQVEKKIRGLRMLFCDNCSEVLQTIKTFKSTCLDSLNLLQEILNEQKPVDETLKVEVKVEVETASDDEEEFDERIDSGDSDYNPDQDSDDSDPKEDEELDDALKIEDIEFEENKGETTQRKSSKLRRKRRKRGEEREKNCHKCSECDKAFPRPANLRNHFLKKHRNAKHCKYCQKAFENEDEFDEHMSMEKERLEMKKSKQQKLHVCEICGLTTKFRSNLVKHMDTHLPDDNCVKCEICNKSFKSQMLLKNHVMYHKEKTFCCNLCSRKFLFAKDLERHGRLVHEKLTEYTNCSICGKQVSAKGLNSHIKQVHMDIRPHTCPVCNLAFKSSSNLKKHLYSHSGTRPYNCHLCGHGSYMSCTLKEHYQKIHGLVYNNDELNAVCVKTTPAIQPLPPNRNQTTTSVVAANGMIRNTEIVVTFPQGLHVNVQQVEEEDESISNE